MPTAKRKPSTRASQAAPQVRWAKFRPYIQSQDVLSAQVDGSPVSATVHRGHGWRFIVTKYREREDGSERVVSEKFTNTASYDDQSELGKTARSLGFADAVVAMRIAETMLLGAKSPARR